MPPQQGESSNDERANDLREPLLNEDNNDEHAADGDNDADGNGHNDSKDIVVKKCSCCKGDDDGGGVLLKMNHNVFLNLTLSVLYGISNSLWSGTAYVAYLKKMGHGSNGPVGDIEAVSGLASLVCALPIGYLADKIGRSVVIRAGGILLFVTACLQICILEWAGTDFGDDDNNTVVDVAGMYYGDWTTGENTAHKNKIALWLMGVIMVFWGLGDGVVNGPCQALFADSTPEGQRSTYFTYQFVCYLSASSVGPLVSIILFRTLGDEWDMSHLRLVIYAGLGMEVFNAWLMMLFDDKKALDEDDQQPEGGDESSATENDMSEENDTDLLPEDIVEEETASSTENTLTSLQKKQKWIPYLVFASGLISSLGSGMTVKFFPLFFKDDVGLSPSQVQVIYFLVPVVMVVLGALCTKIASAGVGRVQTTALYEVGGISLLLTIVAFKEYLEVHPFLLVPIYVMRTSLMNSTYPLQESILMDFVPKDQRARWKSLDSVASFGWCGSAAFGGWLADKYGYTHTFKLTAIFQIVALGLWCCLLPLVPRVEGSQPSAPEDEVETINDETGGAVSELSEPLL